MHVKFSAKLAILFTVTITATM